MRTALLFAGQGSQAVGMGRALCDAFPEAREVFARADDALDFPLTRLVFEGPAEQLERTEFAQPAILTVACAQLAVLTAYGFRPDVVAGHSLGEYGALVAAGALDFAAAVRICRQRGAFMQAAVEPGVGAMAAILGLDEARVEAACAAAAEGGGVCGVAAYNAPNITVIAGDSAAVAVAEAALVEAGGQSTRLAVSAPFHCALLAPAADRLAALLATVDFGPLSCPYLPNVSAVQVDRAAPDELRRALFEQVTAPVRWRQTIAALLADGVERFWHVGPGRAGVTHVKAQARKALKESLDDMQALHAAVTSLKSV